MPSIDVRIKWDVPDDPNWLNPANLELALSEYCTNTLFRVSDISDNYADLQRRNNRTYCAYCGYEVPLEAPDAVKQVHDHIRECEHHPLGIELRNLRAQIQD